ncbi:hypothetical protein I9189_015770 [Acinetobacter bereziniae]|uniref:phage tail tip lysozyme n=1 Tax=Acinetobacter bereziniae TaxID=106648 RepID=UPI0019075294|nr:phage tail tip lysozyme [Acinetobacter bereziniae]QQC79443.1 hypothetical protein I9192_15905 [Acinetobacter bereziniae]UUN92520.1 hypothetical protein I9189_015770 [Acinetobacter bereziniae]
MASLLQKQVYQAYLNAGLSPNQARIITAEVGREGSFSPKNLFGVHIDPKNGATNLGMLSWQGSRGQALYSALKAQGLIRGNGIAPTQDALNMMARFSIDEMRNKKEYRQTAQTFLNNPDVDYQTGAAVLGRNFIRWRYDDPVYKSGHVNRDKFYQAMGGEVGQPQPSQRFLTQDQIAKRLPKMSNQNQSSRFLSQDQIANVLPQFNQQQESQSNRFLNQDQISQVLPQLGKGA